MDFDNLGKKECPGTFGKIKVGQREYPKSPSVKKHEICSDPISADPICPFPMNSNNNSSSTNIFYIIMKLLLLIIIMQVMIIAIIIIIIIMIMIIITMIN